MLSSVLPGAETDAVERLAGGAPVDVGVSDVEADAYPRRPGEMLDVTPQRLFIGDGRKSVLDRDGDAILLRRRDEQFQAPDHDRFIFLLCHVLRQAADVDGVGRDAELGGQEFQETQMLFDEARIGVGGEAVHRDFGHVPERCMRTVRDRPALIERPFQGLCEIRLGEHSVAPVAADDDPGLPSRGEARHHGSELPIRDPAPFVKVGKSIFEHDRGRYFTQLGCEFSKAIYPPLPPSTI